MDNKNNIYLTKDDVFWLLRPMRKHPDAYGDTYDIVFDKLRELEIKLENEGK